jgi:hypothetical protein
VLPDRDQDSCGSTVTVQRASGEVTPSTVAVTPTTTVDTPGTPAVGFSMSAFQRDGPVIVADPPSAAIGSDGPDTRRHDQVAEPPVTRADRRGGRQLHGDRADDVELDAEHAQHGLHGDRDVEADLVDAQPLGLLGVEARLVQPQRAHDATETEMRRSPGSTFAPVTAVPESVKS